MHNNFKRPLLSTCEFFCYKYGYIIVIVVWTRNSSWINSKMWYLAKRVMGNESHTYGFFDVSFAFRMVSLHWYTTHFLHFFKIYYVFGTSFPIETVSVCNILMEYIFLLQKFDIIIHMTEWQTNTLHSFIVCFPYAYSYFLGIKKCMLI